VSQFKKVLLVFPHPDDETVNCGGTANRFSKSGSAVTVLLLTRGERGNPEGRLDTALGETRRAEAIRAASILGASSLIHEDLGDGCLDERREEVGRRIAATIEAIKPDLIVTYDLAGLDGHSDHMACAELLTDLHHARFPDVSLWYAAQPRRLIRALRFVGQLRTEAEADRRRALPTVRIFVGAGVIPKVRAWYAYRSQRGSIAKGLGRLLPTWFAVSMVQYEHFAEVG
jgi:LmbE family N-acetylglucosaminyl deacetylase